MDPNAIMLGKYSLPFILSIVLSLIFKRTEISNELKPYISIACGIVVGVAAMFYNESYTSITFVMISDYVLAGGMAGAAAVGIYEVNKQTSEKASYVAIDQEGREIVGAKVAKMAKMKIMN